MDIPQTQKLANEELTSVQATAIEILPPVPPKPTAGPVKIRPIACCNEFVAVLRSEVESTIELGAGKMKDEGVVVGVGPGVPLTGHIGSGYRVPSQLAIGDVVMLQDRSVVTKIKSDAGPYAGREVVILSERNILAKLRTVEFEIVE